MNKEIKITNINNENNIYDYQDNINEEKKLNSDDTNSKMEENIIIENFQDKEKNILEKKLNEDDIIIESVLKMDGDIEIFRYFKNKLLGSGAFSKVYEVTCEWSNEKYACKIISKNKKPNNFNLDKIFKEINLHKRLAHPNILQYIHYFSDTNYIYILTELCKNKTLRDLLDKRGTLSEIEIQYYALQIISAVKYLNDNHIYHRDLKLSNIFLTENMELKVGDFGLSAKLDNKEQALSSICGTIFYMPPEIIKNSGLKTHTDIWSFGVILYILCTGTFPFNSNNIKKIERSQRRYYYRKPYKFRNISAEFCDLIDYIFQYYPIHRPNWTEIRNHNFFKIGKSIPKSMPISTLDIPPNNEFIKTYLPNFNENMKMNKRKYKKYQKEKLKNKENNLKIEEEKNNENKENVNDLYYKDRDEEFYFRNHLLNDNFINNIEENKGLKTPEIFVREYIDESHSFGLVYLLNNGYYGIYFNNKSKLIIDSNYKNYFFLKLSGEKIIIFKGKINKKTDADIKSYLKLLKIYKEFFDKITKKKVPPLEGLYDDEFNEEEEEEKNEIETKIEIGEDIPVHVQFWAKTNQAKIFGLTDNTFQTKFIDHTEILLSIKLKTVTYIGLDGKKWIYKGDNAFHNNRNYEMTKRLFYVKNFINLLKKKLKI